MSSQMLLTPPTTSSDGGCRVPGGLERTATVRLAAHSLPRLALSTLTATAMATPAAAVPVTYTMRSTLRLIVGSDAMHLTGATMEVVATTDTDDLPVSTVGDFYSSTARYDARSVVVTFSNRPGGAPDAMVTFDG